MRVHHALSLHVLLCCPVNPPHILRTDRVELTRRASIGQHPSPCVPPEQLSTSFKSREVAGGELQDIFVCFKPSARVNGNHPHVKPWEENHSVEPWEALGNKSDTAADILVHLELLPESVTSHPGITIKDESAWIKLVVATRWLESHPA